jgi:type IV secretory pathway TraG/TraD family ATPase VirD4
MCLQDIRNQHGVCFIDPHGESIKWLLSRIPANRLEDVILFDPSDTESPVGFNMLDFKEETEKDFLVAETIAIFYKLFDPQKTGVVGPQFEHWLRNAAYTVMAGPNPGSLIDIPRLFVDKKYEQKQRSYVTDPVVQDFWSKQMAKTSDFHRSEMLNYFSSKFGQFSNNEMMRNIIGQRKTQIDFDHVLSHDKILLVDLSKGKIGESNTHLLGLILIAKLQNAIMKRARLSDAERLPFYLYVDEFQNFMTDTFISLLSESRKYGLGVQMTNQYFAQLTPEIQKAILGNVGSLLLFTVGIEDAEVLAPQFAPMLAMDLANLPKYNFYIKLMVNGRTTEPFSGMSLPPLPAAGEDHTEDIQKISRLAYGLPKEIVETEIEQRLR